MFNTTKLTLLLVVIALAVAAWPLFGLVPEPWPGTDSEFHRIVTSATLFTGLHIGAGILFLIGTRAYRAKLRRAYMVMVVGIVLISLGLAQVTYLTAYGLMNSAWAQQGGLMLPFLLVGLLIYAGVRSMALQVKVNSPLTRWAFVLPIAIASAVFAVFLPHGKLTMPELYADIGNAVIAADLAFYAICIVTVLQLKSRMGAYYTQAMAWLALGFIGSTTITTVGLMTTLGVLPQNNVLLDILLIVSGLIYLKAGLEFAKTGES